MALKSLALPEQDNPTPVKKRRFARLVVSLLGTILLGAVGSGVWDIIAKPGLNHLASVVLNVASYFSTSIGDLPYDIAALNPYPLPSLISFSLIATAAPVWFFSPFIRSFIRSTLAARFAKNASDFNEQSDKWLKRDRRIMFTVAIVYGAFILAVSGLTYSVLNKAILVRRVWDANFDILAAHVPNDDVLRLRAQFASMQSREDYIIMCGQAKKLASEGRPRLRNETDELK